ncbi:hypothetical protein PIB30_034933 [Stylosanthes scabra]|uniref:Leucine-rich repeat-containing N-terminal plant-type domain-containing protein n=1 Tax=Stylosanthes scabra TaxID=79078 RepID=A0ABU6WBC5_9FABA|nr:hypothetical protein [Stylosanthes scabra]
MILHCDEKDESILIKFKLGVTDPSGLLSSWSSHEKDCCKWKGVHCDNITRRVTELRLPCDTIQSGNDEVFEKHNDEKWHCLSGELDMSSLFDLEFLSYLDLSNNDFKTIKTCNNNNYSSNIHHLDLAQNYDLFNDYNMLHQISHLSSLQYLDLSGIDLYKEAIDWLQPVTLLSSLSELHLDDCNLKNINPSLQHANFTNSLRILSLAINEFSSILPAWLFNLSHISYIDLSENFLHAKLPQTLPKFHQSIESLFLLRNNLDGTIPDWLGQLDHLYELDLSYNSFTGPISTALGNLTSLIDLRVNSNFLTGIVSGNFFQFLSKLKNLGLGSKSLIFDFDTEWSPPFQLHFLALEYLGPEFPSWIYTQSSLEICTLQTQRKLHLNLLPSFGISLLNLNLRF